MELITAEEARRKSEFNSGAALLDELEGVFKAINKAIEKGSMNIWWYTPLSSEATQKLVELGYKVEYYSHRNEDQHNISW